MLAPAKLNLSLRILHKRPDGFHEIDTLMVKLPDLADELTFTPAESLTLTCDKPEIPTDDSNLVIKAANALANAATTTLNYHIHLKKIIPHGAGLGGGSSDAAATLLFLNTQLPSPLPLPELEKIAASLGSDIPFFLHPGAARCTGRGEIIQPCENPPPIPLVLFKPDFAVPTPDAYRNCLNTESLPGIPYHSQKFHHLKLLNDLEKPVFAKHRYLAELKLWLLKRRETHTVLMSGSGSTLFAILQPKAKPKSLIHAAHRHFDPNLWTWTGNTPTH